MAWKRSLVFAWHGRDADGGFDDCVGSLDDFDAAPAFARANGERRQLVDTRTGAVARPRNREPVAA